MVIKKNDVKRGDSVAKAWAGAMLAAQEENYSTVSVFKHPLYFQQAISEKVILETGFLTGVQSHHNPIFDYFLEERLKRMVVLQFKKWFCLFWTRI